MILPVRQYYTLYIIYVAVMLAIPVTFLSSCSGSRAGEPVEIRRLDLALRADIMPEDPAMQSAAATLFSLSGYGQLTDSAIHVYNRNPAIRLHDRAMDSVWHDMQPLENSLGRMRFSFEKLFPGNRFPSVIAIVSPFNQSVFTVDSLLYLGLNHYLGSDYPPYAYFPDYIRASKTPERLLPDISEAIVRGNYPYRPSAEYPTALSRMLYEGAVTEAVMQICGLSEQQALGYDTEAMKWADSNEHRVWQTLAEQKMIFSTDPQLAAMLVSPAPFTSAINPRSPGAIGRFIGHRIISATLDRHAIALPDLLSPAFYDSETTLSQSGYK